MRRVARAGSEGRAGARHGAPRRRVPASAAVRGPSASSTSSASSAPRCSTSTGPGGRLAVCTPTWARPSAAPSTTPALAARKVPTSGPGTRPRPSSSKTTAASASPRPVPDGSGSVNAKTPVSPSAAQSSAAMACSWPSRPRRCSSGIRPASMDRMPSASSRWSSPTRKSISAPSAGPGSARPRCCVAPGTCLPRSSG